MTQQSRTGIRFVVAGFPSLWVGMATSTVVNRERADFESMFA